MSRFEVNPLRIGTRGSALALWQTRHVAALLEARGLRTVIETIRTTGDEMADVPLWQVEGKAFFSKELDDALLDGRIDVAVHSLKDLPTALPAGIALGAVPPREDPRDVLITHAGGARLETLPRGARVGTSSVRRRAFVRHWRSDVETVELRGNVPTRIAQLDEGRFDAIILAAAGIRRLGLANRIDCFLEPETFTPAVAQGALGVCARADDREALAYLAGLEDTPTRIAVTGERAFLARLEAGCQVPAGALARLNGEQLTILGAMCAPDGSSFVTRRSVGARQDAAIIGHALADALRAARPEASHGR